MVMTEEQKQFQTYAEKYSKYYGLFQLAFCTGMRNGEIRGLSWTDIDFEKRIIHVTGTLKYTKGVGRYKETPK